MRRLRCTDQRAQTHQRTTHLQGNGPSTTQPALSPAETGRYGKVKKGELTVSARSGAHAWFQTHLRQRRNSPCLAHCIASARDRSARSDLSDRCSILQGRREGGSDASTLRHGPCRRWLPCNRKPDKSQPSQRDASASPMAGRTTQRAHSDAARCQRMQIPDEPARRALWNFSRQPSAAS